MKNNKYIARVLLPDIDSNIVSKRWLVFPTIEIDENTSSHDIYDKICDDVIIQIKRSSEIKILLRKDLRFELLSLTDTSEIKTNEEKI